MKKLTMASKLLIISGFLLTAHLAQAAQCSENQIVQGFNENTKRQFSNCELKAKTLEASVAKVNIFCENGEFHQFLVRLDSKCNVSLPRETKEKH